MFSLYYIQERCQETVTSFAIGLLQKTNKYKNRCLAARLHKLSLVYEPSPGNTCKEYITKKEDKNGRI